VACKATLGGAQNQLPAQIARHAKGAHIVSKHSPLTQSQEYLLRCKITVAGAGVLRPT
jgi:hypothetical protein